jgi:hypothetical protein
MKQPKFKIGDRVRHIYENYEYPITALVIIMEIPTMIIIIVRQS